MQKLQVHISTGGNDYDSYAVCVETGSGLLLNQAVEPYLVLVLCHSTVHALCAYCSFKNNKYSIIFC